MLGAQVTAKTEGTLRDHIAPLEDGLSHEASTKKQVERRNPRVHVIYEDEQGQTRIGEELVEEKAEAYAEDESKEVKGEETEGVHSIGMEDTYDGMYSETDYFLGL